MQQHPPPKPKNHDNSLYSSNIGSTQGSLILSGHLLLSAATPQPEYHISLWAHLPYVQLAVTQLHTTMSVISDYRWHLYPSCH